MLLLFSWRRRAWKERCSRDCIYNGIAARAAAAAADCLTGLTRLTDTSSAANMAGLLEEEGFSFPICYGSLQYKCKCNPSVMGFVFCLVFLLLLQEKACAAQEEDEEGEEAAAVDKEKNKKKKPQIK